MDFLQLAGKNVLVMGVANRKSVAFHTGKVLREAGANVLWTCHTEERKAQLRKKLIPEEPIFVVDVDQGADVERLGREVQEAVPELHGLVHSIAFANYSQGLVPFQKTVREDFLQAVNISCFSLIATANALEPVFADGASAVTIGISTTTMAAQNYGYMAPVKAALDSAVVFLAKSFGGKVRFNGVRPGLLKTQSSAGIPGYVKAFLHAEQAILRKQALKTEEVANTVAFLLSPRSSGINAQGLVIDAGMYCNYFDETIVERVTQT